MAQTGSGQALAERGGNPPGDENVACHGIFVEDIRSCNHGAPGYQARALQEGETQQAIPILRPSPPRLTSTLPIPKQKIV